VTGSRREAGELRFVVYGAGAIGGVIGGRLFEAGHDVTLIARGGHEQALRSGGLVVGSPDRTVTLDVPVAGHPGDAGLAPGDVVVLAMKSQDTAAAVHALAAAAPDGVAVVCAQNGVDNERTALRSFADVYAMHVMCPATHLEPGVVVAHSAPVTGILDLGRYPGGVDATATAVAEALAGATFASEARADIMRWKRAKLLLNLVNAVEAVCGRDGEFRDLSAAVRTEGEACLRAAGLDAVSRDEDRARRGDLLTLAPVDGMRHRGGSSWQSLTRRVGTIETDYLNGEIVLLGRLHGIPTPANELLQRLARDMAAHGRPPGEMAAADVLARL
jgi:2-dehydropantoate 2-reductase